MLRLAAALPLRIDGTRCAIQSVRAHPCPRFQICPGPKDYLLAGSPSLSKNARFRCEAPLTRPSKLMTSMYTRRASLNPK